MTWEPKAANFLLTEEQANVVLDACYYWITHLEDDVIWNESTESVQRTEAERQLDQLQQSIKILKSTTKEMLKSTTKGREQ